MNGERDRETRLPYVDADEKKGFGKPLPTFCCSCGCAVRLMVTNMIRLSKFLPYISIPPHAERRKEVMIHMRIHRDLCSRYVVGFM